MSRIYRLPLLLMILASVAIQGCATPAGKSSGAEKFGNLLVIAAAGSWDSRAQFERVMVSSLRADGVKAQSYNLIAGADNLPTRDEVLAAVDEHGFDAVVVTRVLGSDMDVELRSGAAGAKVKRKESGFMKLFRYDYEELDDPPELTVNTEVELVTELHSVESEGLVWATETRRPKSDNIAVLIDESAKVIARKLARSGHIAR